MDQTNLSSELGASLTGEQMRRQKHKPGTVVLVTLAVVLLSVLILPRLIKWGVGAVNPNQAIDATFAKMPENWVVDSHTTVASDHLKTFSHKLGGSIVHATNTVIRDDRRRLQINRLQCADTNHAAAVQRNLQRMKGNSRQVCRNGLDVYGFVCRTPAAARFAIEARYRLPIQPRQAKYRIQFDAIPVARGDATAWNKLFNLFLRWHAGEERDDIEPRITELLSRFQCSEELALKNTGLGSTATHWNFFPEPSAQSKVHTGDATHYKFLELPKRAGAPIVKIQGLVTSITFGKEAANPDAAEAMLQANEFWPVDSPAIRQLSAQITGRLNTDRQKVAALLSWFCDEQNIRFAGETGSRYGTLKVLQQKHGHCWDYSDLFVTLCRASGIPARQVLGWLHHGEGHVWAEVLADDHWQQFDPTTGLGCGSDYLSLVVSDDGRMPLVYASPVKIELLQ